MLPMSPSYYYTLSLIDFSQRKSKTLVPELETAAGSEANPMSCNLKFLQQTPGSQGMKPSGS